MDAPKLDKGKETPERVPAPPVPARPSLLRRSAAVPWWLLRGLAKMNHETKAGLVVSASFLCLVGVVLYSKMKEQEQPAVPADYHEIVHADANGELQAELPADPTPSGTAEKSTVTDNELGRLQAPPRRSPADVLIQTSATGPGTGDTAPSNGSGNKAVSTALPPHSGKPTGASGMNTNTVQPNIGQGQHSTDLNGLDYPMLDVGVSNNQNHAPGTDSGHGLGTSKTQPPTRVIPASPSKTQPNTFHLGGHSDNSQNQNTPPASQPVGQAKPATAKPAVGNSAQTDATQHSQNGLGAATTSQIKPNAKATKKDHGSSLADHSGTGSNSTDVFGQNTGGISSGGIGSPAGVTNPLDFHIARPLPTGSANNASVGSATSIHDKGVTKNGLTENSQRNPAKTDPFARSMPGKNSQSTLGGSQTGTGLTTSPQDIRRGATGVRQPLVMPAPETLMGNAHTSAPSTQSTAGAVMPPAKTTDPGVKLGQVVPTPAVGAGALTTTPTAPLQPRAALVPLPRAPVAPVQVAQATTPYRPATSADSNRLSPPVGATPTVSTAPVSVPMPSAPAAPAVPRVASWDEEMYHFSPGDSLAQISQKYFGSPRYAQALLRFNRERQPAVDGLRQDPPLVPSGSVIYIPPARVLEEKYPNAIEGYHPPAPTTGASLYQPAASPGTARMYKVGTGGDTFYQIAQKTLHNESRWTEIYQLNKRYDPAARIPAGTVLWLPADAAISSTNVPG